MKGSQLGYILNSDMTVTSTKQSGKTPIGVVVCSYADGGGQAMSLNSIGNYYWSTETIDLSKLPNYTSMQVAVQEVSSCKNSAIIMSAGNSSKYPAVWAANSYSTNGTKAGDWCLPAAGIFYPIDIGQSISVNGPVPDVNDTFGKVGGTSIIDSSDIWTSSEYSATYALSTDLRSEYSVYRTVKNMGNYEVRPVIGFCKSGYEYDKSTDSCKIRSCPEDYKATTLQPECSEYDTCQSGSTTYYRCTKCYPCSTLCGGECVLGYEDISKLGYYEAYTTCEYNGTTYYQATSCKTSVDKNNFDSSRGICYIWDPTYMEIYTPCDF